MNQAEFSDYLKKETGKSLEEYTGSSKEDRFSKFSVLN